MFYILMLSNILLHSVSDLDLCCGVGWELLCLKLLDGSGYFGGSQGQEERAGGHSEYQ